MAHEGGIFDSLILTLHTPLSLTQDSLIAKLTSHIRHPDPPPSWALLLDIIISAWDPQLSAVM